jgi:hypothetical protein
MRKVQDLRLLTSLGCLVVYAGFPYVECGGSGWIDFQDSCNTGGPCHGNYNSTTTDPFSSFGYTSFGTHCQTVSACGYITYAC